MPKIYVQGQLNQVHSSRRLDREAQRNVELMRLNGRLVPDFKTIADFRKDNGEALVAIDGSKFNAVNNRDKNFTRAKMKRRVLNLEDRSRVLVRIQGFEPIDDLLCPRMELRSCHVLWPYHRD